MRTTSFLFISLVAFLAAPRVRAEEHGPAAPYDRFPSHVFRLAPHEPERVQLGFNYGLSQPILMHGLNAAVEVRYRRFIATYSHGQGLDYSSFATSRERSAGAAVHMPWTTGGGIGVLVLDEMWVLADLKVHRFELDTTVDHQAYSTVTVGAEVGWRFFVWKGFNLAVVARYWPNVYASSGKGVTLHDVGGKTFVDPPAQQGYSGLLANVLVGWAFDL